MIDHFVNLELGRMNNPGGKLKEPSGADSAHLQRLGKAISLSVERFVTVGETIGEEGGRDPGRGGSSREQQRNSSDGQARKDMLEACRESRHTGKLVEKLAENLAVQSGGGGSNLVTAVLEDEVLAEQGEETSLLSGCRTLMRAITKVLLLADNIVVKQLLLDKETNTVGSVCIKHMNNFSEFVKAFCDFGQEMVELTAMTRWHLNQAKALRQRAQIECARLVLDRSTVLLVASTKCCLRHPDSASARENRDTVFCQMRRAIDLIHFVIREGMSPDQTEDIDLIDMPGVPYHDSVAMSGSGEEQSNLDSQTSIIGALKHFENSVDMMRMSSVSPSYCEQVSSLLDSIIERTQDFTDSAYTSHEHRQNIIMLSDRAKMEMSSLLRIPGVSSHMHAEQAESLLHMEDRAGESTIMAVRALLQTGADLRGELSQTAVEHTKFLADHARRGADILHSVKAAGFASDPDRLQVECDLFAEHIDYVEDVCKLISHVAVREADRVRAKHSQVNLHIYGPQVIVASNTFCMDPTSKIAKETFEDFCDMWRYLVNDVIQVAKEILESFKSFSLLGGSAQPLQPPKPNFNSSIQQNQDPFSPYLSRQQPRHDVNIYRPPISSGVNGQMGPPPRMMNPNMIPRSAPSYMDRGHPDGMPIGNDMRYDERRGNGHQYSAQGGYPPISGSRSGMTAARDILDSYKDVGDENDILKRARAMLLMAQTMHNFTRGEGKIKTTQDFFTQAEFFAEESNRLYKLIRMFSYIVPTGEDKRVLMQIADHIPRHCGQMQLLIQMPGVGKESTFRKVDSIIKENNQIMYLIAKVVQICFANAKKYNLDFRGITLSGNNGSGDDSTQPFASSGAGASSSNLDSGIGFGSSRRGGAPAAAQGNKRTRVSFLLY